jgi:hypothetical protein
MPRKLFPVRHKYLGSHRFERREYIERDDPGAKKDIIPLTSLARNAFAK